MTGDCLTILRSRGGVRLAKSIGADGTIRGYDRARTFDLFSEPVADLGELETVLQQLGSHPNLALVRGAIANPEHTRGVRRLLRDDAGDRASLVDMPRAYVPLDIDGFTAAPDTDFTDLLACARQVLPHLPAPFAEATLIVQATSSHGIAPGLHLRFWGWLDRPVSGAELKIWFKGAPVDPAIFCGGQVIYTARPVFESSAVDPLPERLAVRFGTVETVAVPSRASLTPPPRPPRPLPPSPGSPEAAGHAALTLSQVATAVLRAPVGARHKTVVIGARRLAELEFAGLLAPATSAALLTRAARGAGFDDARLAEVDQILAWARRTTTVEGMS